MMQLGLTTLRLVANAERSNFSVHIRYRVILCLQSAAYSLYEDQSNKEVRN